MILLALDTASAACSVALWRDGDIRAHRFEAMRRGHAEVLLSMVVATLADGDTGFDDLDQLAVTVGPGSFTGIRAGLAAARGLALANATPLAGFTTLETVAFAAARAAADTPYDALIIALETGRSDFYVQWFGPDLEPLCQPASLAPEAVAAALPPGRLRGYGDGMARLEMHLNDAARPLETLSGTGLPDAADLARIAVAGTGPPTPGHGDGPAPLYLHPPQVTAPAKPWGMNS